MADSAPATAVTAPRYLRRGRLRAWLAPGVDLEHAIAADGDPDHLLTRPDCRIVKLQRKVLVGRLGSAGGALWVKRYAVFAWRVALVSLGRLSPAFGAWEGARVLAAHGFATPEPVAAIEFRRAGLLRKSFFITREVAGAVTADVRWQAILADPDARRRRAARRALARALGELFRRLHAAGLYHNDLKDVNVLVDGPPAAPHCVLLDLERVRALARVGRRRRVKNLVQLARTLGRQASATDRARFLRAYLGETGRLERRAWAAAVARRARRKDQRRRRAPAPEAWPSVTCTVVCQDEEAHMVRCLESVAWCNEIVVVDGGSRDRTEALARRFTDRVLTNPWPGYRAQKQFALDSARGEWVLNLDADERISPELADEIRAALAHVPALVAGFAIPRLVCYLGRWWYRGDWYPRRVVRLVRRAATRWGGTDPHERAEVRGRVVALHRPILHYSYADISDHLHTLNKLTAVAAEQPSLPRRIGVWRLIGEPAGRFVRAYLVRGGVRDGFPGLFVAATGAFYVFLRWAKVRERRVREGAA
ncbi:MAG TPA: lipopolysaccharide kinase InaA family protein [Verrucomicrobiae bacterium]|nr:lipopolysaccharide kinase InaA family protein [Verrucomicrobiae bacterium]